MFSIPKHRHGDLFQNSNDDLQRSRRIACVGDNGGPYDTGQIARGYFAAAHQLLRRDVPWQEVEPLPLRDRGVLQVSIDLKVYPILYCYRHGIELALKHLLFQIPRFFKEPLTTKDLKGHPLNKWWKKLLPYLNRIRTVYGNDADSCGFAKEYLGRDKLTNIGSIISEIDKLDSTSTAFRYAIDQSGTGPLGNKQHIVLDKLYGFMLPVSVWFEEMICRSDVLVGPMSGLEPKWLRLLDPPRIAPAQAHSA